MSQMFFTYSELTCTVMQIDWSTQGNCFILKLFDDLIQKDTCVFSHEVLNVHPMSLHVKLLDNKSDDPSYNTIQKGDPVELVFWYNAIDAELKAFNEKHCFELVNHAKAED